MTSPYLVPVAHLLRDIPSTKEINVRGIFDENHEFEARGEGESDVDFDAEVSLQGRLDSYSGGLRMRGVLQVPWHGMCRRCSSKIQGILEIPVDERFSDKVRELSSLARARMVKEFEMVAERGLMIPCDVELVTVIVNGAMINIIMEYVLEKKDADLGDLADALVRNQLRALTR